MALGRRFLTNDLNALTGQPAGKQRNAPREGRQPSGGTCISCLFLLVGGMKTQLSHLCAHTGVGAGSYWGSGSQVKVGPACLDLLCGDTEAGQGDVLDKTSRLLVPWSSPSARGRVGVAARRSWLGAQSALL